MAILAADARIQVRVFCTRGDQTAINVLNYIVNSNSAAFTETGFVNAFSSQIAPFYKGCLSASAVYYGCDVRVRGVGGLGPTFTTVSGQGVGNETGGVLPRQVSGLIGHQSEAIGRHGKGRIYVPFPAEDDSDVNGRPTATYIAHLQSLADALGPNVVIPSGANTISLQLGVFRRDAGTVSPGLTVTARSRWATQRRRGDYGRVNGPAF